MSSQIPEGYIADGQGNMFAKTNIKPEKLLEDDLVRRLVGSAQSINNVLREFLDSAASETDTFKELIAEKYGVVKGGAKGNMTLRSFDGSMEVQVAFHEAIEFGPAIHAAKELIDNCVERWSEGVDDKVHALITHAFQVNKQGRIDVHRVLALKNLEFDDPEWTMAMQALKDATQTRSSRFYYRFYAVDPETGKRTAIPLDIAAV